MCVTKEGKPKISVAESITTGSSSKTSATGLAGMGLMGISLILFMALIIFYFFNTSEATVILEFTDRLVALISIAAAILGVRKVSGVIANNKFSSQVNNLENSIQSEDKTVALND